MAAATALACEAATSVLPSLEPLLGASLALNLAYLNLSKFAYITVVKESIGGRLKRLDPSVKDRIKDTPWYVQMSSLAAVDTLDHGLPSPKKGWVKAPGIWGFLYNLLFYWRLGRALSILATVHALSLLILGVGHQSGAINLWRCHFSAGAIGNDFLLASLGVVWPIFMVTAGTLVCSAASKFVKYQTANLAQAAKSEATEALGESQKALEVRKSAATPKKRSPAKRP
jgi:hypothetical protein